MSKAKPRTAAQAELIGLPDVGVEIPGPPIPERQAASARASYPGIKVLALPNKTSALYDAIKQFRFILHGCMMCLPLRPDIGNRTEARPPAWMEIPLADRQSVALQMFPALERENDAVFAAIKTCGLSVDLCHNVGNKMYEAVRAVGLVAGGNGEAFESLPSIAAELRDLQEQVGNVDHPLTAEALTGELEAAAKRFDILAASAKPDKERAAMGQGIQREIVELYFNAVGAGLIPPFDNPILPEADPQLRLHSWKQIREQLPSEAPSLPRLRGAEVGEDGRTRYADPPDGAGGWMIDCAATVRALKELVGTRPGVGTVRRISGEWLSLLSKCPRVRGSFFTTADQVNEAHRRNPNLVIHTRQSDDSPDLLVARFEESAAKRLTEIGLRLSVAARERGVDAAALEKFSADPIAATDDTIRCAKFCVELLRSVAAPGLTTMQSIPPVAIVDHVPEGPALPNRFCWKGKEATLAPIPFKLINFLWNLPGKTAQYEDVVENVWGDPSTSDAMESAKRKANKAITDSGCPLAISVKNGHVTLS